MGVFIYLDDVDKHYEVAKAAGAEIVHPPKDAHTAETTGRTIPKAIPGFSPRLGSGVGRRRENPRRSGRAALAASSAAGQPAAFCAAAKKPVDADPPLAAAVAAAFGKVMFNAAGEDCVYPLQVLYYATADVLIVQAGEPGHACHGCGAPLSAHVLRRVDDGLRLVRAI